MFLTVQPNCTSNSIAAKSISLYVNKHIKLLNSKYRMQRKKNKTDKD